MQHGHRPIVLLGGGTTRIGDPSGKDKTRKILMKLKLKRILKVLKKYLKNILITIIQKLNLFLSILFMA